MANEGDGAAAFAHRGGELMPADDGVGVTLPHELPEATDFLHRHGNGYWYFTLS